MHRKHGFPVLMGVVNEKGTTVTIKDQSGPPWIDSEVRHLHKHTARSRAKRAKKSGDLSTFKKE